MIRAISGAKRLELGEEILDLDDIKETGRSEQHNTISVGDDPERERRYPHLHGEVVGGSTITGKGN